MIFRLVWVILVAVTLCSSGCYTLSGISISPETKSYAVEQFDFSVVDGPADSGQRFSELLKQKVNNNTRLGYDADNPDVSFSGAIVGFSVVPEAPTADNVAALNRLTIRINVEYVDTIIEKNSYTQTFTDYELYDGDTQLLDVQDDLLATLFDRMSEDAFNKAFSNW